MKEQYVEAEMDIVEIDREDVIATSPYEMTIRCPEDIVFL